MIDARLDLDDADVVIEFLRGAGVQYQRTDGTFEPLELPPEKLLGIALATAGVVLLAPRGDWRPGPGEGWTLLGALAFGLEIIAVARFAPRVDPAVLTGVQALTVAVTLAPSGRRAPGRR